MKPMRFAFFALALFTLFAASAVMADEATVNPEELFIPVLQTADGLPLELTASAKDSPNGRANGLRATGQEAMVCEWFGIYCGGVFTDVCCGTVNGCLVTCAEVCGGPCVYDEDGDTPQ